MAGNNIEKPGGNGWIKQWKMRWEDGNGEEINV